MIQHNKNEIKLRPVQAEDILPYHAFLSDPVVAIWLEDQCQRALTVGEVERSLFQDMWSPWAIEFEGDFIGVSGFSEYTASRGTARFFIVIGKVDTWGKGVGSQVVRMVIEKGFRDLGLRKINSDYLDPNEASRVIHERNGFVIEGKMREEAWRDGKWVDRVFLSILQSDWGDSDENN